MGIWAREKRDSTVLEKVKGRERMLKASARRKKKAEEQTYGVGRLP